MDFLALLLLIMPAYVANSIPVVFGRGARVDGGKVFWDKRPLFGEGKTWRGLLAGVLFGSLSAIPLAAVFPENFLPFLGYNQKIFFAFALSAGAMAGDLLGSFIKRRQGIKSGEPSFLMDQLLFVFTALIFGVIAYPQLFSVLNLNDATIIVVMTYFLHAAFNAIAHALKLKKVPW